MINVVDSSFNSLVAVKAVVNKVLEVTILDVGRKGEVFLIDVYGIHQGNPVKERTH